MLQKRRDSIFYFIILMPALMLLILFFMVPVVQSLVLSFTDAYGMKTAYHWIGLSNYFEALSDRSFIGTIGITFRYTLVAVLGGNLIALALALMLDGPIRGRNALRAVFFIPNIMSLLVVGYVWRFVYTGALPDFVQALGLNTVAVLGKPKTVIYSLALVAIWNSAGYFMVIYLSSLQGISEELIEAARMDGAGGYHILRHIKLPLLMPAIITCLILSVAAQMKTFEIPYTMTSGGPAGASMTMVLKIYNTAFNANRTGYATAQSTILFVLIAAISFLLNSLMRQREEKLQ